MKKDLNREIEFPEGVSATLSKGNLTIKGPKGEVSRDFFNPRLSMVLTGNKITMGSLKATKREQKIFNSFTAHIKNMLKGVQEPFTYTLKICSGHFPMNVSLSGEEFVVKNLFGESVPRKVKLSPGTNVKIQGTEVTIQSPDKELAGQNATKIEQLCRITGRDRRIFQDGIYLTHKAGKEI